MAKKHTTESVDTNIESLSKAEAFITKNNKKIVAGVIIVVVAVCGYLWYKSAEEKKDEAGLSAHASVETNDLMNLSSDSEMLAEFEAYMSEHEGHTPAIASFQAAIRAYNTGDYSKALQYFSDYSADDAIFNARAKACAGICYVNLEQYENALNSFEAAVAANDGIWTPEYAFYAGLAAEKINNTEKALEHYNFIKNEYPNSYRAAGIDKYIGRVEAK